jgi:predicted Zn-dependent protease
MSASHATADTADRVADRIKLTTPWEVFAEKIRRYEVHLNGRTIELIRGPIALEGYGVRLFHPKEGRISTGFQASTDLSDNGIQAVLADAESVSKHSDFPAKRVELPAAPPAHTSDLEIVDHGLWERPSSELREHVETLLAAFDGKRDVVPSFGSVRATLSETSIANSAGLRTSYPQTTVEFEIAVKAFGGPEGAPPGEYWVNETSRRLETKRLVEDVDRWCGFARDVRRASPPPTGELPVVLPAGLLSTILPSVIGFRFSGQSRLRQIAPEAGSEIGAAGLSIHDDGRFPWGLSSGPVDDEGVARARRALVDHGKAQGLLYDLLYAGAFDQVPTGNALRGMDFGYRDWKRFASPPATGPSTLVVDPGTGGSDAELVEAAGEGIWVQQLGWAFPDPLSGAFGGEIRIGYRIRHGKLAEPVRGGTMGGVVLAPPGSPSMLTSVAGIGSHSTLAEGVSTPTWLVRSLTVAGA